MARISSWLNVPVTVLVIIKNLSAQREFINKNIDPLLSEAAVTNDGSLDDSDFIKIRRYYGLAVPAILGESFCLLHGKKMSLQERSASTSQGAMTGLFDDFFDKQYLSDDSIREFLEDARALPSKSNERLFATFYKKALQEVPDKKMMQEALTDVYNAQLESKKQTQETITEKELRDISFFKGGASLIFYRTAFLPPSGNAEKKLLYDLGSMMQLANDIFDVYKDREKGIRTLFTETSQIRPVRKLFEDKLAEIFRSAYTIGHPKKNVSKFLSMLSLAIFSRAFVCLDQLDKIQSTTGNSFRVQMYSRKQLICDMEKAKNLLRSARYHAMMMDWVSGSE